MTVLGVDTEKNPPPNVHYIHIENIYDTFYGQEEHAINLTEMVMTVPSVYDELSMLDEFGSIACEGKEQHTIDQTKDFFSMFDL